MTLKVSVQKCHNAPICGLFAKPANLIFKFPSLKISLIQADCHRKQVFVVRSTRFHGLEQSLEILPERDSDLLASQDKGIEHCRSQCTLNTTEEQRALALYGLGKVCRPSTSWLLAWMLAEVGLQHHLSLHL